jgi:Mor family transcriptional regulator
MKNPSYNNIVRNINNQKRGLGAWHDKIYSAKNDSNVDPHHDDVFGVKLPSSLTEYGVRVGKVRMAVVASSEEQAIGRVRGMFGGDPVIEPEPFKRVRPTDQQVIEMYEDGDSLYDITQRYKVSTVSIMEILRRNEIKLRRAYE